LAFYPLEFDTARVS